MGDGVLPIVGERLVKRLVSLRGHLGSRTGPNGRLRIELLVGKRLNRLWGLVGFCLGILHVAFFGVAGIAGIGILFGDWHVAFHFQVDGVGEKGGVLLDHLADAALLEELQLVLLEVQHDAGPADGHQSLLLVRGGANVKRAAGIRLPHVGVVTVLMGEHANVVGHEVRRVEAHAELADERGGLLARRVFGHHGLHELARTAVGDDAEALHQFVAAHADAVVFERERLGHLVGHQTDPQVVVGALTFLERPDAILVNCIAGVGQQLANEDVFLLVKRVDDEREKLIDFRLERIGGVGVSRHGVYVCVCKCARRGFE